MEFDPTANYICTSSFDKTIKIYDLNLEKVINTIDKHTDKAVLSKWHPFYPFILSTSADKTARLYITKDFLETY